MKYLLTISLFVFLLSCSEEKMEPESFDVNIRLERDPGRVNPFYAATSIGREVFQYVFVPLADYHPDNLELYPILIESIPEAVDTVIDGKSLTKYLIDFKDDIKWSDGRSLTNEDYLFTMQMIKHPLSKISAWKPYFEALRKLELDANDSTQLTVYYDSDYMLSKEISITSYVLPRHVYDKDRTLLNKGTILLDSEYQTSDSLEIALVEAVNESANEKIGVVQLGPYELKEYQTDEYILLDAKADYWGNAYLDNVFLQQNASKLIFRIVPDEVAAVNMAKDGQLDLFQLKSSATFLDLQEDSLFSSQFNFHIPQIMQYYFICMNNTSPILSDVKVRIALSHLANVDDYIQNIDGGLGTRIIGHIHPSKSYYNDDIEPISFDPELALRILNDQGWSDTNNDGILDKNINGKHVPLKLDFYITGSSLSQSISLLYKEAAKQIGVEVNIINKTNALLQKENLKNYNFDMAALSVTMDAAPDDLYDRWHSEFAKPGTRNQAGYANPEADKYIEQIRTTRSPQERKLAYLKVQEIIHLDQPVIFLYSPMQKIIISNKLKATTTAKRPGYMANTFVAR